MARLRRTWGQRILIGFNCLLVLACLAAAAGLYYADRSVSEVPRLALGSALAEDKPASAAQNILLVGVDDSSNLAEDDPVLRGRGGEKNTDTIMILRVDPGSDQAYLLSLPRDLWVEIANTGKNDKINAAQALGGPENLIATIKSNFGIEIDHYAQVNLAGFKDLVGAVDGVPLYFPWPARDKNSGLAIEEPGCITLDPDQALALTRSRYFEKFENGRWQQDPIADLGRIQRQQLFMRAALKRAISKGVRNPFTLNELVSVAQNSVRLDDTFTGGQIVDLGMEFRDFNPDSLVMFTAPVVNAGFARTSALKLVDADAQPILDIFRGASVEGDTNASTAVEIRNGTGVAGQGSATLGAFADLGFFAVRSIDANSSEDPTITVVRFQPGQEAKAVEVARHIDGPFRFQEDTGLIDVNVAVVTGDGFVGVRAEPVDAAAVEAKLPTTTTTTALPDMPTAVESTTTTTVEDNPFVPTIPEGVSCG